MSAPRQGTDSTRPPLLIFHEEAIRQAVDDVTALKSAETAFEALARGRALVPPPLGVELPGVQGEVHVKGAWIHDAPIFAFKAATGFYANASRGLPSGSGLVLVFDSSTGFPLAVLADNGHLTDLRTAAAGALAVRLLAPESSLRVAVLGTGVQGRMQIRLTSRVREVREVHAWSPRSESRDRYAEEMGRILGVPVIPESSPESAVSGADLVITATPARKPLLELGMLSPGVTVVALGSDGPEKSELSPDLLSHADKVVTDLTDQCLRIGELHHAVNTGAMVPTDVHAELGQILVGARPGREGSEDIVCDLTGVGAQDAAIAAVAYSALVGAS